MKKNEHKDFYLHKGKNYISVTTAIKIINNEGLNYWRGHVGNRTANQIRNESAEFGILFDQLCHIIDIGDGHEINMETLKEPLRTMVNNYKTWFYTNVSEVLFSNKRFYSDKYLFCGEPDLIAVLKGKKKADIIDRKTGGYRRTYELQLSAYKELMKENDIDVNDRILLISEPGKEIVSNKLEKSDHLSAFHTFLYSIHVYKWYNKK